MADKEELRLSAVNFGFDGGWIADIMQQWGDEVLALAIEATRNGLSVGLVVEILSKFGPSVLDFFVNLLGKKKMMAAGDVIPGPIIEGMDSAFVDLIVEKYLPQILEKFLPLILEKFGPQLMQLLAEMLLKNLTNK